MKLYYYCGGLPCIGAKGMHVEREEIGVEAEHVDVECEEIDRVRSGFH